MIAGEDAFGEIDIRVRVKGGGHTSQVYAIRQAIAKALVAYYAKYVDAYSAIELKKKLVAYDRALLIADPRRMEPKKFGGAGARARRQKRCVFRELAVSSTHKFRNSVIVSLRCECRVSCAMSFPSLDFDGKTQSSIIQSSTIVYTVHRIRQSLNARLGHIGESDTRGCSSGRSAAPHLLLCSRWAPSATRPAHRTCR